MNFKVFFGKKPALVALAMLVLAYIAQVNFDSWRFFSQKRISVDLNVFIEPQPLGGETARLASFGAREFLADWYWLTLIQYYGGGDPYGKYRKLAELFDVVTDLSPKFVAPYQTGLLILPGEGYVDEALALSEKGKQALPGSWEIPYYTGLIYHRHKKDFAKAAQEFEQAAQIPDAPPSTKLFAGIYYKEANQRRVAYEIFKTIYETSQIEFTRDRARRYIGHLDAYFLLEDAVGQFKQRFGRYPASLDELVARRIISTIPVSPLGQSFAVNPATGEITESKR